MSLHVPLTDATRNMIDADGDRGHEARLRSSSTRRAAASWTRLRSARRCARGISAARRSTCSRANPWTPAAGAPFADVPNLVLTPHIAGVTDESNVRVSAVTAEAVARHLDA